MCAKKEEDFSGSRLAKLVFLISIVAQVIAMGLIGFGVIPVTEPAAINNTIFGTLVATFSVYLLYMQTDIRRKQVTIEEKLYRYETEPALEIVDKDFNGNDVTLLVSNYGHGVAVELELNCRITAPKVDWFKGVTSQTTLNRKGESGVLEDSSIRPQEDPDEYVAETVTVGRATEEGDRVHQLTFETAVQNLIKKESSEKIQVSLWVSGKAKTDDHKVRAGICEDFTTSLNQIHDRPDLQAVYRYQQ